MFVPIKEAAHPHPRPLLLSTCQLSASQPQIGQPIWVRQGEVSHVRAGAKPRDGQYHRRHRRPAQPGGTCERGDLYGQLGPRLTYNSGQRTTAAGAEVGRIYTKRSCPRGDTSLTYMPAITGDLLLGGSL